MQRERHEPAPAVPAWVGLLLGFLLEGSLRSPDEGARGAHPFGVGGAPEACAIAPLGDPPDFPSPGELRRIEGVGHARALRAARGLWEWGLARGPQRLDEVEGIGPVTAGRLRAYLAGRASSPAFARSRPPP